MASDLEIARVQCTQELELAIVRAVKDVMKTHGADPEGHRLIIAGFVSVIQKFGEVVDPRIPVIVCKMLEKA